MKNLLKLIIIIFGLNCNAQNNVPIEQLNTYLLNRTSNNIYFKDVNGVFDKFIGSWKYETTTDLVEIEIKKELYSKHGGNEYYDELYVEFKYTKNGVVIYNTIGETRSHLISGLRFKEPTNTNKYHLLYLEPIQRPFDNNQYLDIEYIPSSNGGQPQLNWVVFSDPSSVDPVPAIMPLNMVLTKLP